MSTHVMRIVSELQGWGSGSRYRHRLASDRPTLSAIVGLIDAANGVSRTEGADALRYPGLQVNIRVDRPGRVERDYHTINHLPVEKYHWVDDRPYNPKGNKSRELALQRLLQPIPGNKNTAVTTREYRCDAAYTVFLTTDIPETDAAVLQLSHPEFGVYAGKKACMIAAPGYLGHADIPVAALLELVPIWDRSSPAERRRRCVVTSFTEPSSWTAKAIRAESPAGRTGYAYRAVPSWESTVEAPVVATLEEFAGQVTLARPGGGDRS